MKISQRQAALLAKQIHETLKKNNVGEIDATTLAKVKAFKKRQAELKAIEVKASTALENYEEKFDAIKGNIKNLWASDSLPRIIQKLKEIDTPTVQAIEDEIILKSMFADENDLNKFVDVIVKKFTPKKRNVAVN